MDTTTIHHLPVADLAAHPDNLRTEITDLAGLSKSIKAGGVIEPLIVIPHDGGHRVVAGHRRLAAAVEADLVTVPCWVRDDLTGDVEQVVTMLAENIHRQDLTSGEQAKGFAQLALLDISDTKAARLTGISRSVVKKARAVAADPLAADTLAAEPGLTFDQALAVAEIVGGPDGDPADAQRLAKLAVDAPGRFEHYLSQVRRERDDAQRRAERIEELTAQGVTVVDHDEIAPPAAALRDLTSADVPDGEFTALDPDAHADCPGHAVSISPWDPERLTYWCLDAAANGHRTRWPNRSADPADDEAERERRREERRTVIANNKAWRSAEPVRREHVRKLLAAKRVPKGTLRYLVSELLAAPESFGRTGDDNLLANLTGTSVTATYGRHVGIRLVERATDARLPLMLLAQHAADVEGSMGVHTWRNSWDHRPARYLAYLAGTGYTLSEIEQQVVDTPGPTEDGRDSDPDVRSGASDVVNLSDRRGPSDATESSSAHEDQQPVS